MGELFGICMSGFFFKSISIFGKFISFFGNLGDGKLKGVEVMKEDCDVGWEKL